MDIPFEPTRGPVSLDLPDDPADETDLTSRDRDGRLPSPPSLDLPNDPEDAPDDPSLPDEDSLPGDPGSPDRMAVSGQASQLPADR